MPRPRISIVIPTRDRPATLAFSLRTCLAQDFEDFEVVVSDNYSPPATREVVESFADRRIKYVRTSSPLAMTDSLEFAVGHASGEFISIIGDDDGYLPHALAEMDRLLRMVDTKALRWSSVVYNWPDIVRQQYALPNTLLIPLRMEDHRHFIDRHDGHRMIQEGARFNVYYSDLPMIFCSVIHRDLFEQLRRKTGRVFKSRTPDVYAAFAIAYVAGAYHSLNAPLAIAGLSGKSTGISRHFVKGSSAIDSDFRKLNDRAGYALQSRIPDLPPIASAVGDAFLYVKEALFPDDESLTLDRRQLIATCLLETEVETEEEWRHVLGVCRNTLSDDADLLAWFDSTHGNLAFDARPLHVRKQVEKRYGGTYLNLDASEFGVQDVAAAAVLCEQLLGYKRDGVNAHTRSEAAAVSPLVELQEKEAMIQLLDNACKERLVVIEKLALQLQTVEERYAKQPPGPVRRFLGRMLRRVKSRAAA